jgi:hypothetical protein
MRTMINSFEGKVFYESSFDPKTGQLVRLCEEPEGEHTNLAVHLVGRDTNHYDGPSGWETNLPEEERQRRQALYDEWHERNPDADERWRALFNWRKRAFSPVPETLDLKITNNCGFGCPDCYMDSRPGFSHAPFRLFETVFSGLDFAPYQIAIGGGEPTLHPELPEILKFIRGKGTVPNYTTAGYKWRKDVIDATNEYCGGVALSYHPHKGLDYFLTTFRKWREALKVQLNVHVIADKNGAKSLRELLDAFTSTPGLSPAMLSLVLLAYHPQIGRASLTSLMPKSVYMVDFPNEIKRAVALGAKVAFSEGLLPFFFSRPELGLDLRFVSAMEGSFSCFVDDKGNVTLSSFNEPDTGRWAKERNLYTQRFQDIWNTRIEAPYGPGGASCYECAYSEAQRCVAPHDTLLFMCAWEPHNKPTTEPPLSRHAQEQRTFWARIHKEEDEA